MSPTDERIPRHSVAESLNNCRKYIRQIEWDCENLFNLVLAKCHGKPTTLTKQALYSNMNVL